MPELSGPPITQYFYVYTAAYFTYDFVTYSHIIQKNSAAAVIKQGSGNSCQQANEDNAEYETLGLIDNDNSNGSVIDNEDDEVWDDGDEDDSDDDHDILGGSSSYILLRLFTQRLPNISEQAKNGLFDIFTESSAFGVREHNALLDALADPVNGLSLFEYDQLYY
uniref:Uncharacterized protein n=1 Tax=Rhizophagus irregularis (strain DAOM 181602 / DAOM 197198 / MUCL 43194) TaxID=747089 RepID=U9T6K0_RHIID